MRAYELYEVDAMALGIYDPAQDRLGRAKLGDTRKPRLTFRHLNRLKHIRNARQKKHEEKLKFVAAMYSDTDMKAARDEIDMEREQMKHELEMAKLEIEREIDVAELDNEQRQKIKAMALKTVERKRKQ